MDTNCALLIGVDDYTSYDASIDKPKGTSDLRGSLNDVRAWFRLCRDLGYAPENIRVLTSPELAAKDLEGAHTGPATAAAIREGVAWLAAKLGAHPAAAGVLTFSGHGDETGKGLVICPTDTTSAGGELEHVVGLAEVQKAITDRGAAHNLTVSLDCCHASDAAPGARRALSLRDHRSIAGARAMPSIGDRSFFAAELGQSAYQAEFDGRFHGAFTWAFMTTRDQWTIAGPAGHKVLTISYADMRARTQALLDALSFGQIPALRCAAYAAALPLFNAGPMAPPGETSHEPDGCRMITQCDPGGMDYRVYTISQYTGVWQQIGQMVVPRTSSATYSFSAGTEYWNLTINPTTATQLYFSWVDYPWSTRPPWTGTDASFTMTQAATWAPSSAPSAGPNVFVTAQGSGYNNGIGTVCLSWGITGGPGRWGGTLTWYNPTGTNTVFGGMNTTYMYLPASTAAPSNWFSATLSPR